MPDRGSSALAAEPQGWEVDAVREAVDALEPFDPAARDGWMGGPRAVQAVIESRRHGLLRHSVQVVAAGRTDAGVHARV